MKRNRFLMTAHHLGWAVCGMALLIVCGCQTLKSKGPSDSDLIAAQLSQWKAGMEAQDIEKTMTVYSEAFRHVEAGDKAGIKSYLKRAMDEGYLNSAVVTLDKAKTEIKGGTATVYPVTISASFGSATLRFYLTKENDGVWRLTNMDIEGV